MLALSGCVSPIALNRAVGAYDEAITSAASKQLLMNIARAHHHQPLHFTGVSNVAATFDFRFSAVDTPALGGACRADINADIWRKHRGKPHYQHCSNRR